VRVIVVGSQVVRLRQTATLSLSLFVDDASSSQAAPLLSISFFSVVIDLFGDIPDAVTAS
jgi:hypothetical protein